jgi:hypothetical protein
MLTYHERLERVCKRKGYIPLNVETLFLALCQCTVYKFKRNYNLYNWQYEVEMPGYGVPANKEKWIDVQIIGSRNGI